MFEMMVPGHKVGLIIGKAGETIKQLQEQSGAKIVIIQVSTNYSGVPNKRMGQEKRSYDSFRISKICN